ncbi:unnamed protein product [Cunninghamella blakesleeana]
MKSSRRSTARQQQKEEEPLSEPTSPNPPSVDSEDEGSDDNAITRCPCGKEKLSYSDDDDNGDNDEGLMLQCDQCEVWQHCICVGFEEEKDIPDQYYCELCRPQNHKVVKIGKRIKRSYNPNGFPQDTNEDQNKPNKRRKKADSTTSRKSSRNSKSNHKENSPQITSSPLLSNVNEVNTPLGSSSPTIGAMVSTPLSETMEIDEHNTTMTRSKRNTNFSPLIEYNDIPSSAPSSPSLSKRKKPASSSSTHSNGNYPHQNNNHATKKGGPHSPSKNAHHKFHKSSSSSSSSTSNHYESRSSTPQQSNGIHHNHHHGNNNNSNNNNYSNNNNNNNSNNNNNNNNNNNSNNNNNNNEEESSCYWNEQGLPCREGSPPARVKYPNPKMSMADMNKRAKQIMDHLRKLKSAIQTPSTTATATTTVSTTVSTTTTLFTSAPPSASPKPYDLTAVNETSDQSELSTSLIPPLVNSNDLTIETPLNPSLSSLSSKIQQLTNNDIHSIHPHPSNDPMKQRTRSLSTSSSSSSLSSASTLPLFRDDDELFEPSSTSPSLFISSTTSPSSPLPIEKLFDQQQHETSVEIMDRIYRDLLKFQRKFGIYQVQQPTSSVR